ncbi:ATP-binding protein [Vibrio fluvialis]|nr:ATP-binding protein [Vibrio fluvialis]
MRLNFRVSGLGKIDNANINIAPLTVITGPNGTGKSFFTKTLYSIFRMAEELEIRNEMFEYLQDAENRLDSIFNEELILKFDDGKEAFKTISTLHSIYLDAKNSISELITEIKNPLHKNEKDLLKALSSLTSGMERLVVLPADVIELLQSKEKIEGTSAYKLFYSGLSAVNSSYKYVCSLLQNDAVTFSYLLQEPLKSELKDNFQVDSLDQVINKDFLFYSEGIFGLAYDDDSDDIAIMVGDLAFFKSRPTSVFFESPAYWRVRDALISAKMKSGEEYLSGVPKYFFDLDDALRKKSKTESKLLPTYEKIKAELSGEFIFENGQISYFDDILQKQIPKNLVSFGMTNLGMLNALIKNNVIKKGSYVFIDEPETNLHPDWQVLMIHSLVALSQAGVNVVINTHSTEILKYIEIAFSKIRDEQGEESVQELLAVNYLDIDGTTLEFDSECPVEQAKEALSHLSSPFFDLYMQGK